MNRKAFLLLLIQGFLFCTAFGQPNHADSLELMLKTTHGRERVDILNKLTYQFITRDNKKVEEYGQQAITLSKEIKYQEGEARAYTYRGVYAYLSGQFEASHRDLNRGLKMAIDAGYRELQGYALLQLGVCSLEEVENDSALFFFRKSYAIFKDSTDPTTLSKLYRNISALYGQRNQSDSQRIYLDRAIAIRKLLPGSKALLAESLILKANITLHMSEFAVAESLLEEAEVLITDQPDNDENRYDIQHMRALILFQQGKFDKAIVLSDSARNYYFKATLLRKYVTLLSDLGRVFSDRGEYELALNNLYDGLKISKSSGYEVETSIIRNQIGWINYRLGDLDQALSMANEAMIPRLQKLLPAELANALTLKGVVLTDLKDYTDAQSCLDSVLQIYTRINYNRGISEALLNLGNLESKRGNYNKALTFYKQSVSLAETIPYNNGLAWSFWGMADIYFKLGEYKNSTHYLDQSQRYAKLISSNEILVLNFNTRRDLLAAQGRFAEALKFSILASQLNDSIHRTDVTRRFANLEKIQEIEQRDRNIRELQKDKLLAEDKIHLQEAKLKQQSFFIIAGIIGSVLLAILAFVYYRFYSRIKILNIAVTEKNTRIQAQSGKLHEVNLELERLYREVSVQKEKIQAQADALSENNKSISDINRSLEKIVAEKTVELRTTNEELIKHNGELLQFSYTVSHNLRGPVARLLGLSHLALAEKDWNEVRQWIELISKTSADLDLIIKDLSKILELRNMPHKYRETVELEAEWSQSWRLLQDSLNGKEEIITNFESLPQLTTVRAMVQSIFYNLLSNAIKFRSPKRNLRVIATSKIKNGKAILEIADNGLGFDTQLHKDKLFKLYRRFHAHVEGRGLGLYLIKSQIEVLHGTIDVESQPDKGSLFRVILPLNGEDYLTEHHQPAGS